jgi:hypothetical protein
MSIEGYNDEANYYPEPRANPVKSTTEPAAAPRQPDTAEAKYPLHVKLRAMEHEANVLGGFLDMLDEQGLTLGKFHEHTEDCYYEHKEWGRTRNCGLTDGLYDFGVPSKAELIGLYLEIDPKALSAEKDAMYQELVAANRKE